MMNKTRTFTRNNTAGSDHPNGGVLASEQSCDDPDDFHMDSTMYLRKVFDPKGLA